MDAGLGRGEGSAGLEPGPQRGAKQRVCSVRRAEVTNRLGASINQLNALHYLLHLISCKLARIQKILLNSFTFPLRVYF